MYVYKDFIHNYNNQMIWSIMFINTYLNKEIFVVYAYNYSIMLIIFRNVSKYKSQNDLNNVSRHQNSC